jgi:hypothetical protein
LKFAPLRDPKAQTAVWLAKRWDDRSSLARHLFQQATRLKPKTSVSGVDAEPARPIAKSRRTHGPR